MLSNGLREDDIQKLHTTVPEELTDQKRFLSTIFVSDLVRKNSDGWDKEYPECPLTSPHTDFGVVWGETLCLYFVGCAKQASNFLYDPVMRFLDSRMVRCCLFFVFSFNRDDFITSE